MWRTKPIYFLLYNYQQTFFQEWDYALNIWGVVVKAMEGTIANFKKTLRSLVYVIHYY